MAAYIGPDKVERRAPDSSVAIVITKVESIESSVSEMRGNIQSIAEAITKLAIVEERQSVASQEIGRAFSSIKELKDDHKATSARVTALEVSAPANKKVEGWVDRLFVGAVTVIVLIICKKVGLI